MRIDGVVTPTRGAGRWVAGSFGAREALGAAAVAAACMFSASPLAAQVRPSTEDGAPASSSRAAAPASHGFVVHSDDRPRLGVYLRPGCEVLPTGEDCRTPPVVAGVVEGAPAAAAGVQAGDTLLSIDGISLHSDRGRRAMAELEEGKAVRLEVGRETGRRVLRVIPTTRPMTGVFQMNGTAWRATPRADVQVYRIRDAEGGLAEFHFTPTPQAPTAPDRFVVFEEDDSGALRVDVGHPDIRVHTRDGRRVALAELERRVREAHRTPMPDAVTADGFEVALEAAGAGPGGELPRRLIIENAPLARRLESIHRGTLVQARSRIDSLLRAQAELARQGEVPPAAAAGYIYVAPSGEERSRPARAAPRRSEAPMPAEQRLAGAEFRALTAELAEYFPVDAGLLVLRVIAETPAHRLGLRGGDVVIEAGGRKLPDMSTFRRAVVEAQAADQPVEVKWNRKGTEMRGRLFSP